MSEEQQKTYTSLTDLVQENLDGIRAGKLRPYLVKPKDGKAVYALANSPGNAALALCEVSTCTQRQVQTAALEALAEFAKAEKK